MSYKSEGISHYTVGAVPVPVYFPDGDVCCEHCRCYIRDFSNSRRYICFATGEEILNEAMRGLWCPLLLDKEAENESVSDVERGTD